MAINPVFWSSFTDDSPAIGTDYLVGLRGSANARFLASSFLTAANNLSDVANALQSRTNLGLGANVVNAATVTLSAAQFIALSATPIALVAAQGANTAVLIDKIVPIMTYGSVAFTGGGALGAQYGNTALLAGVAASATLPIATFKGTASAVGTMSGTLGSAGSALLSAVANTPVYITNDTAPFAAGNSTFKVLVYYKVVPTV